MSYCVLIFVMTMSCLHTNEMTLTAVSRVNVYMPLRSMMMTEAMLMCVCVSIEGELLIRLFLINFIYVWSCLMLCTLEVDNDQTLNERVREHILKRICMSHNLDALCRKFDKMSFFLEIWLVHRRTEWLTFLIIRVCSWINQ